MKKKTTLKLVLMLVIIAMAFGINDKVNAAFWSGNAGTAARNPHVFCAAYGTVLPYSGDLDFGYNKVGNAVKHRNDEYAYIFHFLGRTGNTLSSVPAQKAYWTLLKRDGISSSGYNGDWERDYKGRMGEF